MIEMQMSLMASAFFLSTLDFRSKVLSFGKIQIIFGYSLT